MVTFRSDMTVKMLDKVSGDSRVVCAAQVREEIVEVEDKEKHRIISAMMDGQHGTPFEHNQLTLYVAAPIMVFREWMRHRIGISYNEYSLRYKSPKWEAWLPGIDRPMIIPEKHSPMRPLYLTLGEHSKNPHEEYVVIKETMRAQYLNQYQAYQFLVKDFKVAKEVARAMLGVGWYSYCWVTFNLRSIIHFLNLRTQWPVDKDKKVVDDNSPEKVGYNSYPQYEIMECANHIEKIFAEFWPVTYFYWNKFHRKSI